MDVLFAGKNNWRGAEVGTVPYLQEQLSLKHSFEGRANKRTIQPPMAHDQLCGHL